jgi:hypothetical protein
MMCAPWLGAIICLASGSARRRTESVKTPVALITTFASALNYSPVSTFSQLAPLITPSLPLFKPVTFA